MNEVDETRKRLQEAIRLIESCEDLLSKKAPNVAESHMGWLYGLTKAIQAYIDEELT